MTIEPYTLNTPENTSLLQSTKFTFLIPDKPFLKYFCQTANIPGVSTSEVAIANPHATTFRHGDHLSYEPLTITALLDEDFRIWEETYNWIKGLTKPHAYSEYLRPKDRRRPTGGIPLYYDAFLTVNTNANNPNLRFKFTSCHPTAIGLVNFDTKVNADVTPTCDFTFRYDTFEIERFD